MFLGLKMQSVFNWTQPNALMQLTIFRNSCLLFGNHHVNVKRKSLQLRTVNPTTSSAYEIVLCSKKNKLLGHSCWLSS